MLLGGVAPNSLTIIIFICKELVGGGGGGKDYLGAKDCHQSWEEGNWLMVAPSHQLSWGLWTHTCPMSESTPLDGWPSPALSPTLSSTPAAPRSCWAHLAIWSLQHRKPSPLLANKKVAFQLLTMMVLPCRHWLTGRKGMAEIPFHLLMVPYNPVLFITVGLRGTEQQMSCDYEHTAYMSRGLWILKMRASVSLMPLPVFGTLYRSLQQHPQQPSHWRSPYRSHIAATERQKLVELGQ